MRRRNGRLSGAFTRSGTPIPPIVTGGQWRRRRACLNLNPVWLPVFARPEEEPVARINPPPPLGAPGLPLPLPGAGGRAAELDALRGIAALVVLLHHGWMLLGWHPRPHGDATEQVIYTLLNVTPLRALEMGRSPVLFFFVLSGFVLTAALLRRGSPGLLAFAAQRSVRLMLPVLAASLLSFGLWHAVADPAALAAMPYEAWRARPPLWTDFLQDAVLLRTHAPGQVPLNPVLWSLVHEWRLTLLMPLVLLFRGRAWLLLALAAGAMAVGELGGAVENRVLLGPHPAGSVAASLYFVPAVAAGAALALTGPLPRLAPVQRLAAGLAALALSGLQSDLAVYAASVLVIVLALQEGGRFRAVLALPAPVWIGRISFSLYLVHLPVLFAAVCLLHGRAPGWAGVLLGMVAALPVAALLHRIAERPARELAVRIERRLDRRADAGLSPRLPPDGPRPILAADTLGSPVRAERREGASPGSRDPWNLIRFGPVKGTVPPVRPRPHAPAAGQRAAHARPSPRSLRRHGGNEPDASPHAACRRRRRARRCAPPGGARPRPRAHPALHAAGGARRRSTRSSARAPSSPRMPIACSTRSTAPTARCARGRRWPRGTRSRMPAAPDASACATGCAGMMASRCARPIASPRSGAGQPRRLRPDPDARGGGARRAPTTARIAVPPAPPLPRAVRRAGQARRLALLHDARAHRQHCRPTAARSPST